MTGCDEHRAFVSALADGESAIVPPTSLGHIKVCPECQRELDAHRAMAERLRGALASTERAKAPSPPARAGRLALAALIVAVFALVAAITIPIALNRADPVTAAAAVALRPPQYRSTDPGQIQAWCRQTSGQKVPVVRVGALILVGARMDQQDGTAIVTIYYRTRDGHPMEISWIDGSQGSSPSVASQTVDGHQMLVVHSRRGMAVLSGQAPPSALRRTAAAVAEV